MKKRIIIGLLLVGSLCLVGCKDKDIKERYKSCLEYMESAYLTEDQKKDFTESLDKYYESDSFEKEKVLEEFESIYEKAVYREEINQFADKIIGKKWITSSGIYFEFYDSNSGVISTTKGEEEITSWSITKSKDGTFDLYMNYNTYIINSRGNRVDLLGGSEFDNLRVETGILYCEYNGSELEFR